MIDNSIKRLQYLCDNIPQLLENIDEQTFSAKPNPEKWSKKEIIGHLIDSATNNHHRIVRGQFEDSPKITYDQNNWNKANHYQQIEISQIILFWTIYNMQIIELIKLIPADKMKNLVVTGEEDEKNSMTIEFLIEDYIRHLEYHLKQVVTY